MDFFKKNEKNIIIIKNNIKKKYIIEFYKLFL